jgi:Flp pilus assembly protein TadG
MSPVRAPIGPLAMPSRRNKCVVWLRRLPPVRQARRLFRRQDGAAAVEFALIATPFLALMFAIIESALVFFAGQALEATAAEAARKIMTGQAQLAGYSQNDFKTNVVCAYLNNGISLFNCNSVMISVQTYTSFSAVDTSTPIKNGALTVDPNNLPYSAGQPGDIVAVRLYYEWPIYVSLLSDNLSNIGNKRLLIATQVFRNEPYK